MNRKLVLYLGFALLGMGCLTASGLAQQPKAYLHLYGGLNRVLEYGSEDDYIQGENDFPITPCHTTASMGLSFGYFFTTGLALELDARYHTPAEVSLTDPSDGDRVTIDTAKHTTLTVNALYQFRTGGVRPYLLGGMGVDTLVDVETKILETEFDFEFELKEPEKKTEFMFNLGGGVEVLLGRSLGMRLDARYVNIPKGGDHPQVQSLNVTAGLTLRF